MKTRAGLIAAAALALPLFLASCGGSDDTNSGERPSAEEISNVFKGDGELSSGMTGEAGDAVADCLGKELEASELPNGVLRSLVEGEDEASIDKDNEEKYTKIVTDATTTCMTEALEG